MVQMVEVTQERGIPVIWRVSVSTWLPVHVSENTSCYFGVLKVLILSEQGLFRISKANPSWLKKSLESVKPTQEHTKEGWESDFLNGISFLLNCWMQSRRYILIQTRVVFYVFLQYPV